MNNTQLEDNMLETELVTRTSIRTYPSTVTVVTNYDSNNLEVVVCFPTMSNIKVSSEDEAMKNTYQHRLANILKNEFIKQDLTASVTITKDYENGVLSILTGQGKLIELPVYSEDHNEFIMDLLITDKVSRMALDRTRYMIHKFTHNFYTKEHDYAMEETKIRFITDAEEVKKKLQLVHSNKN